MYGANAYGWTAYGWGSLSRTDAFVKSPTQSQSVTVTRSVIRTTTVSCSQGITEARSLLRAMIVNALAVTDASFESDTVGQAPSAASWTNSNNSGMTTNIFLVSNTWANSGSKSLHVKATHDGSSGGLGCYVWIATRIPVTAGCTYTIQAVFDILQIGPDNGARVEMSWYNASGGAINTVTSGYTRGPSSGLGVVTVSYTGVAPANAATVSIGVMMGTATASQVLEWYVDDIALTQVGATQSLGLTRSVAHTTSAAGSQGASFARSATRTTSITGSQSAGLVRSATRSTSITGSQSAGLVRSVSRSTVVGGSQSVGGPPRAAVRVVVVGGSQGAVERRLIVRATAVGGSQAAGLLRLVTHVAAGDGSQAAVLTARSMARMMAGGGPQSAITTRFAVRSAAAAGSQTVALAVGKPTVVRVAQSATARVSARQASRALLALSAAVAQRAAGLSTQVSVAATALAARVAATLARWFATQAQGLVLNTVAAKTARQSSVVLRRAGISAARSVTITQAPLIVVVSHATVGVGDLQAVGFATMLGLTTTATATQAFALGPAIGDRTHSIGVAQSSSLTRSITITFDVGGRQFATLLRKARLRVGVESTTLTGIAISNKLAATVTQSSALIGAVS